MKRSEFADFWRGVFYLISSAAIVIVLAMFVFVWQPIWTEGFKDFHTISEAILKLDETARPASEVAPLCLQYWQKLRSRLS